MIDLTRASYRVAVMAEDGKQYNIKEHIQNLGWEENENEIAVRTSFTAKNDKTDQGYLSSIIKTFFANGGEHIQINVVDDETLRAAQEHPENYRGLMVRVAGYMAYFTELDRSAQDAIIRRTAHFHTV